jgi:hypothetical protein
MDFHGADLDEARCTQGTASALECSGGVSCKIWYLISRTVSEDDAHRDNIDDRSVGAVAVKPRALGAPLCGIGA